MKKSINSVLIVFFLGFSIAKAQDLYVIKKGSPIAFSESGYDKMMDGIANNDTGYLLKLIEGQQMIVAGKEIEVYLVDASILGPTVVRMKGEDIKLYTSGSSLKRKY